MSDNEPPGAPQGGVRPFLSLGVLVTAAGIAAYLIVRDPSSDVTQMVIGGWIAALGNVIGFYFGSRHSGS